MHIASKKWCKWKLLNVTPSEIDYLLWSVLCKLLITIVPKNRFNYVT
jgi:hypothetical protein